MEKYELVIIGAGIAGLSTALAWSAIYPPKKHPVLLLEKNSIPGGCVTTFAREGFRFDTTQIIPDVSELLDFFGVTLSLVKFEPVYARLFLADPDTGQCKILPVASSLEDFKAEMIHRYPEDQRQIESFFSYCYQMTEELRLLKTEPGWYDLPGILFRCKKILANSNKTYHEFLKRFGFSNPEVLEILDIFSSFSGLSGDRCAALLTACAMITTLKGSYRPKKGFIQFPIELRKKFEAVGGEVRTGCKVTRIIIERGVVKGVETDSGEVILSNQVVSTVDTKVAFEEMIDLKQTRKIRPRYFIKARDVKMSPSGFSIHLGLDGELDLESLGFKCGYNVLTTGSGAHSKMFHAWESGELLRSDQVFHLAVISPSTMTGGKQTLIIHVVPAPSEYWIKLKKNDYNTYLNQKTELAEFYINKVDQYMIEGLRGHIVFRDVSTPATFERYIGTPTGSQFDMLPVPSNFGKNRLPSRTPLKGLFITKFSHGIWPSMQAGLQIVDMISGGAVMNGNSSYSPTALDAI